MNISELLSKIKKHPLCKKNLYKEVYKNRITLQWNSDRNCPAFIRWLNSFEIIDKAYFYKKDGTCPNTIVIYCKETYI